MKRSLAALCLMFFFYAGVLHARSMKHNRPEFDRSLKARQIVDSLDRRGFVTAFGNINVARQHPLINIKPTLAPSDLRTNTTTTNGGTVANNSKNLVELKVSNDSQSFAQISTRKRGQYQADASGLVGMAIWSDTKGNYTGSQQARWGYFSDTEGLGFGVDDTGIFVFRRLDNNETRTYQSNWNLDSLSDDVGSNTSGNELFLNDGAVYRIEFTWYGTGDVFFYVDVADQEGGDRDLIPVHRMTFRGEPSLRNPDKTVRVELDNGGAAGADTVTLELGAMQYSIIAGELSITNREINDYVERFTITSDTSTWEPLMAVRRKQKIRGVENTIRLETLRLDIVANEAPMAFQVTASDTIDGGTFNDPEGWGNESIAEVAKNSNEFTASHDFPFIRGYVPATTSGPSRVARSVTDDVLIPVGDERIIVLWGRKTTSTDAVVSAVLSWKEFW